MYVYDDYIAKDINISGNEEILTSDGIEFNQPNIIKHETDNKFLFFDRSKDGVKASEWVGDEKVTIYETKRSDIGNQFLLYNRTCRGYNTNTIDKLISEKSKEYDILNDLYQNALAFQIKDDGSIGYKYLVRDCENKRGYKIEELFTPSGVIKNDEWNTVSIKIIPDSNVKETMSCTTQKLGSKSSMYLYIYVNGLLKLKSNKLPILSLRPLNDLSDKQESVPYNISVGGGTQGLCDVINLKYRELPSYSLPLENEFCGSFIGYISKFRFYTCPLTYTEISNNHGVDKVN